MTRFFLENFILVYFFYGLAFFSMGLAILLELGHASELDFSRALRPLAAFGLIHGAHEWLEMFLMIYTNPTQAAAGNWIFALRLVLLSSSFLMLIIFGAFLIQGAASRKPIWAATLIASLIWFAGLMWILNQGRLSVLERQVASDVYTRYCLAVPGAILTGWGLLIQRRRFIREGMRGFGSDVTLAAFAFILYGVIGQVFSSPSSVFPSSYLNSDAFIRWFGFPVQIFRALLAILAAFFIIRSLRSFQVENSRYLESIHKARQEEQRKAAQLRAELLHRTVNAQETERQRIARELHDQTGQTLTALGMGLRGISENILENPQRAIQQAKQLEMVASSGILELQRLVSGLHPPQLDELGLIPALRWFITDAANNAGIPITLVSNKQTLNLPSEVRVALFRIAQEAITNVIRHSLASKASITIRREMDSVTMTIEDNGRGFIFNQDKLLTPEEGRACWGLLGMLERASLVGGECCISSRPGEGTTVEVHVPLKNKENRNE